MKEKYKCLKEKYFQSKDWIMKHPKKVYKNVMVVLILSFVLIFVQYFCFTPKVNAHNNIPSFYAKSEHSKTKIDDKDQKIEDVSKELQELKVKRDKSSLTKNDSLRIEYLFNQYQNLKNGH
jgi:cell division protein FtsL